MLSVSQHLSLRPWLGPPALILVTAAAHLYGLGGGFISDDGPMLAANPRLAQSGAIWDFFTKGVWANTALELESKNAWRPIHLLWLWAGNRLFGPSALAFHLGNLVLHIANALLLLALFRRLVPALPLISACLGAAVFALHPAITESVAWISGVTDPLMSLFLLASFLAYLDWRDGGGWLALAISLFLFAGGLLCKETAAVWPLVLLLHETLLGAKEGRRRALAGLALFLLLLGLYLILRSSVLIAAAPADLSLSRLPRLFEFLLAALRQALIPWPVPFYFSSPPQGMGGPLSAGAGLAALSGLGVLAWRFPGARFPLAFALLLLLPPLGIAFHDRGAFAARFLYLPLAGLGMALAICLPARILAGLLIPLAFLTPLAAADWRDEGVFFAKVLKDNPADASGWSGLAKFQLRNGREEDALATYKKAAEAVEPPQAKASLIEARALLLGRKGRAQESIEAYSALLDMAGYEAIGQIGIGNNLWMSKRGGEAMAAYMKALLIDPDNHEALFNAGRLAQSLGRAEEARAFFSRLVLLPPSPMLDAKALAHARAYVGRGESERP
jgi:tetratricopeptide (TPR) repeat protein